MSNIRTLIQNKIPQQIELTNIAIIDTDYTIGEIIDDPKQPTIQTQLIWKNSKKLLYNHQRCWEQRLKTLKQKGHIPNYTPPTIYEHKTRSQSSKVYKKEWDKHTGAQTWITWNRKELTQ